MSWIPWEAAWHRALYQPVTGFYRRSQPHLHYATSVCGIPGTADLLAFALARLLDEIQATTFIDIGAGRGDLTRRVSRMRPQIHCVGVEIRSRPAGLDDPVEWVVNPTEAAFGTVSGRPPDPTNHHTTAAAAPPGRTLAFANEWLDVVPCPLLEISETDLPRVVLVDPTTGAERLGDEPDRVDLDWCARHWPLSQLRAGDRIEVGRTRDRAWDTLLRSLRALGGRSGTDLVAVAVDYGHRLPDRPAHGTLSGFCDGRRVRPIPNGSCDLTAHVALDSLQHDMILTQTESLRRLGVAGSTAPNPASARTDPAGYLEQLGRAGAAAALTDPTGLGDFGWVWAGYRPRPDGLGARIG